MLTLQLDVDQPLAAALRQLGAAKVTTKIGADAAVWNVENLFG